MKLAVAVNGANGDLSTQGDSVYTLEATVYPDVAPSGSPAISDGGVILADLFSATATGAPGAIASASGTNFTNPWREFSGTLDAAGKLGAVLNGTCVEVNQKRAPLLHLSPETLRFQIPLDAGLGAGNVQVIRGCDATEAVRSSLSAFQIAAVRPVFLLFTANPPAAAALHLDATLVAPEGSVSGRPSRSALPGDTVVLFGTGFGAVTPALATGELAVEPRRLASTNVSAMLGALQVPSEDLLYVGAAPFGVGLNQVTLRIPETAPAGNHAFRLTVDGVQSPAGPRISVGSVAPPMSEAVACTVDLVVRPGRELHAHVLRRRGRVHGEAGWQCLRFGRQPRPQRLRRVGDRPELDQCRGQQERRRQLDGREAPVAEPRRPAGKAGDVDQPAALIAADSTPWIRRPTTRSSPGSSIQTAISSPSSCLGRTSMLGLPSRKSSAAAFADNRDRE